MGFFANAAYHEKVSLKLLKSYELSQKAPTHKSIKNFVQLEKALS